METFTHETHAPRPAPRLAGGQPPGAARGSGAAPVCAGSRALESILLTVAVLVCAIADAATVALTLAGGGPEAKALASDPGLIAFLVLKVGTAMLACIFLSNYREIAVMRWVFRILAAAYVVLTAIQAAGCFA
ncbi:MAG: hypothetical protein JXP34_21840 [Planctomycetes bacterium]|nr:hypothetical protein [Planctomycetota bacterium]